MIFGAVVAYSRSGSINESADGKDTPVESSLVFIVAAQNGVAVYERNGKGCGCGRGCGGDGDPMYFDQTW